MSRWEPNAPERLERAALDLFAEQGFAETTVPQITARAGLTPRTFFRHFADKREVLFAYEADFPTIVAELMVAAPAELSTMQLISTGLETLARTKFEPEADTILAHDAVVRSDQSLRERELTKRSALASAIHDGFVARGEGELDAALAAELAVTVLNVSLARWIAGGAAEPLTGILRQTHQRLTALASAPAR
ncbi:TetR family transcriptional regulator [Frondihabitans sp. PAMC 28766]|uniref:TetR/AcrR family transcriptional regulator n=1 Tax=Frondihabitans sp. PAMC 28766 TaxID=1795630 RepID=UPI00078E1871|nr:TetR/AcrR family transcriptional regulator [Frondihabitans sp. PAMC 28766]AMM18873.1 TetR family transcriptional regulator [Frondihabitans sp. PAMC 28766]